MTPLIVLRKERKLNQEYLLKYYSGVFKLGAIHVHRKRRKMAPNVPLPWQHSWLQSPSVINQSGCRFYVFCNEHLWCQV